MVIGRDIIPVHFINTYTQFPATGGAGTKFIQMATSASGNYPNSSTGQSVEFKWGIGGSFLSTDGSLFNGLFDDGSGNGILNDLSEQISEYEEAIEGSHDFGYSEISSGTVRTVVKVPCLSSTFSDSGGGIFTLWIAGYLRGWDDASTANNSGVSALTWTVDNSALISSSITNGGVSLQNSDATRDNTQDNTFGTYTYGIYHNGVATTGLYRLQYTAGGGRGSLTYPAVGDNFILRIKADGSVGGTTVTQRVLDIHVVWI